MKGGYVKIYRRLFDHDVFDGFAEAAMFVDFIARAAWVDATVSYKGRYLTLARGQFSMSLRDMAERYDTSVGSVRRRLVKWQKHGLIEHTSGGAGGNGVNVITVCNYDKYQFTDTKPSKGGDVSADFLPSARSKKNSKARGQPKGSGEVRPRSGMRPSNRKTDQPKGGQKPGAAGAPDRQPDAPSHERTQTTSRVSERPVEAPIAHLCPEDFAPNEANKSYAKECGFSRSAFDAMVADMKDWSRAAPGQKGMRNDWQAMFRRWMRREAEARAPNVVPLHGTPATGRQI